MAKRSSRAGRGGKKKAAGKRRAGRRRAPGRDETLLSLSEIGRRTGISYPTLLRYVKLHAGEIPHVGSGRTRRYRPEAVEVFRALRARSTRGRRSTGAAAAGAVELRALERRVAALERVQRRIEATLKELSREIRRPLRLTLKR
jgi:hypothetical protein